MKTNESDQADIYIDLLDAGVSRLARRALAVALRWPRSLPSFARIALAQAGAARRRAQNRTGGIPVPAFLIVSVTRRCNLRCAGCYSLATEKRERAEGRPGEMDGARLARVIGEASALGVSFALIAGGEPFVRSRELFNLAKANPSLAFPVFTNGTLIDADAVKGLRRARNLIPILSVEGRESYTDGRRGGGVYAQARARMAALRRAGIFFGVSFTVMKSNAEELVDRDFIAELHASGAGLFFYNEYTPVEGGTESMCVSAEERASLLASLEDLRRDFPALFLAFPGDEDKYGGCLSSSRGFAHIAPDGRLEACPFAPFGDTSARDLPLAEALKSPLLGAIRAHHGELQETSGGCALWNRRDWAENLLVGAESSGETPLGDPSAPPVYPESPEFLKKGFDENLNSLVSNFNA